MTTSIANAATPGVTIAVDLSAGDALDLAQFLKRVGFSEFRANAVDNDEAYRMLHAGEKVRQALAEVG